MKYIQFLLLLIASSSVSAYTLGPTTPGKWGDPTFGTGATITYSFMLGGESCDKGTCSALSTFMATGYKAEIENAFNTWSSVANLSFYEVPDDGADFNSTTTSGDIRFGGEVMDGASGLLAHGYFAPANGNSAAGDIHFDSEENWSTDGAAGSFSIFWVALHEIGHALGLGHSDLKGSLMYPYYDLSVLKLQADDIAGIQSIYGAPVVSAVPLPAALWLFASGLIALFGFRKKAA